MLCITLSTALYAQLHMSANVQNMHLWRGIEVADGIVITTDLHLSMLDEQLNVGFWGGSNSEGTYKEFNYYANYTYQGFALALSDTYNFSPEATYNNSEFFNYKASETGRFLDATLSYSFAEQQLPLTLSWSTVLFGRDRDSDNSYNRYSTFCNAEYMVYQKEAWQVDAGIGGAFALKGDDEAHFYGEHAGIVHLTTKVTNTLAIGNYELPLFVCAMWNPMTDQAFLQLGAQLFAF